MHTPRPRPTVLRVTVPLALLLTTGHAGQAAAAPTAAAPAAGHTTKGFHDHKGQFEYKIRAAFPVAFYSHLSWTTTNRLEQDRRAGRTDEIIDWATWSCFVAGPAAPLCGAGVRLQKRQLMTSLKAAIKERRCLALSVRSVGLVKTTWYRVRCYR